jgi:hypothetical protein
MNAAFLVAIATILATPLPPEAETGPLDGEWRCVWILGLDVPLEGKSRWKICGTKLVDVDSDNREVGAASLVIDTACTPHAIDFR